MNLRLIYCIGLAGTATLLVLTARTAVSSGQTGALVRLQTTTPGVVQAGHINLGGTLLTNSIGIGTNPSTKVEVIGNQNGSLMRVLNSANFGVGIYAQNGAGWSRPFYNAAVRGDSSNVAVHGVSGHSELGFGIAGMSHSGSAVVGVSNLSYGGNFTTNAPGGTALIASSPSGTAAYMDGSLIVTQGMVVSTAASVGASLNVGGATGVGSTLTVAGATSLNSTLSVTGTAQFNQNVSASGNMVANGRITGSKLGINSINPALTAEIYGTTGDVLLVQNTSTGRGLRVATNSDTGIWATTNNGFAALDARNNSGGLAGYFSGNVSVSGTISKGGGSFKIDHPLDPQNKYLYHSFVESPDMKNIYDGVVTTDERGYATVMMPSWFDALNRDFRYQLTIVDDGSDTSEWVMARVAQEMKGNQFVVRTSKPLIKVSWQVTGIRHDDFAKANRIPVEQDKEPHNQGLYLYPREAGQPVERGIDEQRYRRMEGKHK